MDKNKAIFTSMLDWCKDEFKKKKHSTEELLFITAAMSFAVDGINKLETGHAN